MYGDSDGFLGLHSTGICEKMGFDLFELFYHVFFWLVIWYYYMIYVVIPENTDSTALFHGTYVYIYYIYI